MDQSSSSNDNISQESDNDSENSNDKDRKKRLTKLSSKNRNKFSALVESNSEIQEYDSIMRQEAREGIFDDQEEKFNCDFLDDLDIMKEENDIDENYETEELKEEGVSFIVFFYFKYNDFKEFIFKLESSNFDLDNQYVLDLMENIIEKINKSKLKISMDSKDYYIFLKETDSLYYELRPCLESNHKPNNNLPCYKEEDLLKEIESNEISFCIKDTNIVDLIEINDDEKYLSLNDSDED